MSSSLSSLLKVDFHNKHQQPNPAACYSATPPPWF